MNQSATNSFAQAEEDIALLTGIRVGHTTLHALVHRQEMELPEAKQPITEVSIDGGKVRLRTEAGQPSIWRDYKSVRMEGIYYGARLWDNSTLQDWVNSQTLTTPLVCLGDGHAGIWKLSAQLATEETRMEILDWYHLVENLYKVEGSLKRLETVKGLLWKGCVDEAIAQFDDHPGKKAKNFVAYLQTHRHRLVNYDYLQAEQVCSIGSGAVESSIKQIDDRLKLPGAQWNGENVNAMLNLRCAYLNGAFNLATV